MMPATEQQAIIRLFGVHRRYGALNALADIGLDIAENEFVFVTGPSGAGKSTLLKLLYLGEPASEGQILVDGLNLARISHKRIPDLRRRFGIIFQNYRLIPTRTVFANVSLVLEAMGQKEPLIRKKVHSVLRTVGLEDRDNALPLTLSGGEQQRVAVARAIVGNPKILLADEPTGSLDPSAAGIIMSLLQRYHRRGATVIIATHDHEMIRRTPGRVIHLERGRLAPQPAPNTP
jgi:cell division transport system ATP-binding protein